MKVARRPISALSLAVLNKLRCARVLATATLSLGAAVASADDILDKTQHFEIAAQALDTALLEFAKQANVQMMIDAATLRGFKTTGVNGTEAAKTALSKLLAKSGLTFAVVGNTVQVLPVLTTGRAEGEQRRAVVPVRLAQVEEPVVPQVVGVGSDVRNVDAPRPLKTDAVEEVIVTGTYLRGMTRSASPIQVYSREDMERSGAGTIAQFIQTLPQNHSGIGGASENSHMSTGAAISNNNVVGAVGANLRGFGNDATVTLVNGRRVSPGGYDGHIVDISMLPLSAVERVEIMNDGASAIYGSDAVGGVVNVIMRESFDGAETRARYGAVAQGDRHEVQISQALGGAWDTGSALLSYEYFEATPLSAADRSFSRTAPRPFTLLPDQDRHSLWTSFNQSVGSKLELFGNGLYSQRATYHDYAGGTLANHSFAKIDAYAATVGGRLALSESTEVELSAGYSSSDTDNGLKSNLNGAILAHRRITTDVVSIDAILRGSLPLLPAGPLLYAVGGQYRAESYDFIEFLTSAAFRPTRDITAGFAEVRIPLVGGAHRLDLSIADRYESYSDFGSTNNPQVGLTWQVARSLRARGTYGTSFVAPLLAKLNPTPAGVTALPTSMFPGASPPSGNVDVLIRDGGNPDLQAQTAKTWTLGADWRPEVLPGLSVSLTYYGAEFSERIAMLSASGIPTLYALVNAATLGPKVVQLNPSQARVQELLAFPGLLVFPGTDLSNIGAVIDNGSLNLSTVDTEGLDADIAYRAASGSVTTEFGVLGSYMLNYETRFTDTAPVMSVVDTTFNPPRFKMRGRVVLSRNSLAGSLFVNYTKGYNDRRTAMVTSVSSWTTIDVTGTYDCDSCAGFARGLSATLAVVNATNEDPPFVRNASSQWPIHFDGANANPLGRFYSLQLTKRWGRR